MGSRKKSNLRASQDANEERRLKFVNEALVLIAHEKASYPDITHLAIRVAKLVSLQEKVADPKKKDISYVTFLRPTRSGTRSSYRLQLEMFQSVTFDPAKAKKELTEKDIEHYVRDCPALRAYLAAKDLAIGNLKNTIEQHRREMQQQVAQHPQLQSQGATQIPKEGQFQEDELKQSRNDLTLTITWVERLLRRPEMAMFEIDEENEIILNKLKPGKPPLGEKSLFAPFFKALKIRRQGWGQNEE